jgi:iron complex outermembrane receptor protein
MQFQRKKIASVLSLLLAPGSTVFVGMPAQAQDIRVEVTGSSIRRSEVEGALPVQTITRGDIERTGATSTAELLQSYPAFQGFTTQADSVRRRCSASQGGPATRAKSARWCCLTASGSRHPAPGCDRRPAAVNINNIPLIAIERIECCSMVLRHLRWTRSAAWSTSSPGAM